MISNGFHATAKRSEQCADKNFEPLLTIRSCQNGSEIEVTVEDNGTGIPKELQSQIFTPFFTTKPAGEGTGLGLSISYDVVVKQHRGSLQVESGPNRFTRFLVRLPQSAHGDI